MRIRKIRGYRRKIQQIENWRIENLELRFDLLQKYHYAYADIVVHPWCDISIIDSDIPEPRGKARVAVINGLTDVYKSWRKELDERGEPYYLKIWLFDQRFSKSRVVCAIGERIDYYADLFYHPEEGVKEFKPAQWGKQLESLSEFVWEYKFDEDLYDDGFFGSPDIWGSKEEYLDTKRWFNKLLRKPHRTTPIEESEADCIELYAFKRGDLWIGEIRNH